MQAKMLFLCLTFLATFDLVSANCSGWTQHGLIHPNGNHLKMREARVPTLTEGWQPLTIRCNAKTDSTYLLSWSFETCVFSMLCSQAARRVSSVCNNSSKKKEACAKACGSESECMKDVYLSGQATKCKSSPFDQNTLIRPKKICCGKHPFFTGGKIVARDCW